MTALDPVTFEVIRHRLDSINDEAAATLRHVSGSLIAVESNDLNTVIATASGRVVACGHFVLCQVVSLDLVIADILEHYTDNPGIGPGDQFLTNDPYVGTLHQPDVVLVAPVFDGDRLVAWTGSTVHQSDVGGPSAGGMTAEASSIFDEAIPLPPIRIVEADVMRRDIEREYLVRSRTRGLNALDLAGQVAANRASTSAILLLCRRYGTDAVVTAMESLLDGAERQLRQRLATLPDGRWRHVAHLEHGPLDAEAPPGSMPADVYAVRLTATKIGTSLELDFSDSSPQAPGAINSGYPALANFAMASVLVYLCGGLLWVPGALWRVVRLTSREGTVVHARWPAGLAMSTATSSQAVRICVNACLARLLDASEEHARHVMASCQSAGAGGGVFSGRNDDGTPFASMTLDEATGGGGARSFADGADSSGLSTSPGASCANVEVTEAYLPVLYLQRAESADSGGPGRFRGGVGCASVLRPHRISSPVGVLSFAEGLQHPAAAGIVGGEHGRQSVFAVAPEEELLALLSGLRPPGGDLPLPERSTSIGSGLAHLGISQGGGGYGDPLERDPDAVAADADAGLVTVAAAFRDYATVLVSRADRFEVDLDTTGRARLDRRRRRLGGAEPRPPQYERCGRRLGSSFDLRADSGDPSVCCARCGIEIGAPATFYSHLVVDERAVAEEAPWGVSYPGGSRFVVRRLYCPGCGTQVDVQVTLRGLPPWQAVEPL